MLKSINSWNKSVLFKLHSPIIFKTCVTILQKLELIKWVYLCQKSSEASEHTWLTFIHMLTNFVTQIIATFWGQPRCSPFVKRHNALLLFFIPIFSSLGKWDFWTKTSFPIKTQKSNAYIENLHYSERFLLSEKVHLISNIVLHDFFFIFSFLVDITNTPEYHGRPSNEMLSSKQAR